MSRHETSSSKVNGNFEKVVKDSEKEWEGKCLEFHDFVSWQRNRDETRLQERQEAELVQIILRHEAEMGQLAARWDSCLEKLSKVEKYSLDAVPQWAEILRSSFPHENTVGTSDNPRVEGNQLASRQNIPTRERPSLDSPPAAGASGLPMPPSSSAASPGDASNANPLNTNKLPAPAAAADKEQSVSVEPLLKDNDSDLSSLRSVTPEEPPALRPVRIQDLALNEAVFQSKLLKPSGTFYVLRCHERRGKLIDLFGKTSILPFKDHLRKCRPALGRFRSDQKVLLVYGTKIADADVEWYEQRERTLCPNSSPYVNASKVTFDAAITGRGSGDRNHVGAKKCKDARHTRLSQTVWNEKDSSTSSDTEETDESDASDVSNEYSMSQEDGDDWEDCENWEDEEHPKDDDPEDATYEDEDEEEEEEQASDDSDGAEEPGPSPNILFKSYAKTRQSTNDSGTFERRPSTQFHRARPPLGNQKRRTDTSPEKTASNESKRLRKSYTSGSTLGSSRCGVTQNQKQTLSVQHKPRRPPWHTTRSDGNEGLFEGIPNYTLPSKVRRYRE